MAYSRRYHTVIAVADVSLTIGPGETVGLAGESGCGKLPLAKAVIRLVPTSTSGGRLVDGQDIAGLGGTPLLHARRKP